MDDAQSNTSVVPCDLFPWCRERKGHRHLCNPQTVNPAGSPKVKWKGSKWTT